jgi:hypothetical protein
MLVLRSAGVFAILVLSASWSACANGSAGAAAASGSSNDDAGYGGGFPAATSIPATTAPATTGDEASAILDDDDSGQEASLPAAPTDAGPTLPDGACEGGPGEGDLQIDELLIESVAGAGDNGEWLEIASTLDCVVNVRGLHGQCPHGSKVATFDVTDDLWLPPHGSIVVADSLDPAVNHELPGSVVAWLGHPGDVLRNKGGTLTLTFGGTLVDALTYPALAQTVGTSFAFPSGCAPSSRADFTQWQKSTASWFPGFHGTPNEPNTDVSCP